MSLRPPKPPAPTWSKAPVSALDYEIAQEKSAALGRLGRALERALAALADFDAGRAEAGADQPRRDVLVAEAGVALWHLIVQREACGLRDSRSVLRDYGVPAEVRDRMGAFPPRRG